jgi:N-acetylmuramoyl-L-alanine amidase
MRTAIKIILLCLLTLPHGALADRGLSVKGVRYFSYAAFTRVVFEIDEAGPYVLTKSPEDRSLILAAYDGPLTVKAPLPSIRDGVVGVIELKQDAGREFVVIHLEASAGEEKDFVLRGPDRIVVDISRGAPAPARAAKQENTSIIVLDPGHGGRDTGIVTAQGIEKTRTLDLAFAVKKLLLQKNPRLTVLLTREKDRALSLEEREAFSNNAGASVFVSIHAMPGAGARVYIQDLPEESTASGGRPVSENFLGFEAGSEQREQVWGRQQALHARGSGALGRLLAQHVSEKGDGQAFQAPLAGFRAIDAAAALVECGMEQDETRVAASIAKGIDQYVGEDR